MSRLNGIVCLLLSLYVLLFAMADVSAQEICPEIQSNINSPSVMQYVQFENIPQEYRLPMINQYLLSADLGIGQETLSNRTYSYFENETGKLWYHPVSGYVRWQSATLEEWKTCPAIASATGLLGNALQTQVENAIDFLLSSGLVLLADGEEISYRKMQTWVVGSYSLQTGDSIEKTKAVILVFDRIYLGREFTGNGSVAKVYLGCGGEIVGAEVLWRPIAGVGEMPPDSQEMLQNKWQWSLASKGEGNLELDNVECCFAEVKWLARGRLTRQSRALPYAIVPAEFTEYGSSEPGEMVFVASVFDEITISIGDETLVEEGLLWLSQIPWAAPEEKLIGPEITPPIGESQTTAF